MLIFVACFAGGTFASARYLPELDAGQVGGIAFFLVCGLLGAALSLVGLHLYTLVNELERTRDLLDEGEIFAGAVAGLLFEAGSVAGLAAIVYLLAPRLAPTSAPEPIGPTPTSVE